MKFKIIIILGILVNLWFNIKLIKFAHESEIFLEYIQLKAACDLYKDSANRADAWLAARGIRRDDLKDKFSKEIYPVRTMYDRQDSDCLKFAKYMCWFQDSENEKRCKNERQSN